MRTDGGQRTGKPGRSAWNKYLVKLKNGREILLDGIYPIQSANCDCEGCNFSADYVSREVPTVYLCADCSYRSKQ